MPQRPCWLWVAGVCPHQHQVPCAFHVDQKFERLNAPSPVSASSLATRLLLMVVHRQPWSLSQQPPLPGDSQVAASYSPSCHRCSSAPSHRLNLHTEHRNESNTYLAQCLKSGTPLPNLAHENLSACRRDGDSACSGRHQNECARAWMEAARSQPRSTSLSPFARARKKDALSGSPARSFDAARTKVAIYVHGMAQKRMFGL